MHKLALRFVLLASAMVVLAQDMRMPINADDLKWGPAPNVLPAGAQIAVISGDPFKNGLKLPPNYKLPAHHPTVRVCDCALG